MKEESGKSAEIASEEVANEEESQEQDTEEMSAVNNETTEET